MNLNSPFVILESSWLTPAACIWTNTSARNPICRSAGTPAGVAGFLCYPVSQAADITAFKATFRGGCAGFADADPEKARAVGARCRPRYLYDRGCSDVSRRI